MSWVKNGTGRGTPVIEKSMTAQVWTVRQLLAANLRIPEYQRPYKWGVKNVAQLVEDILHFKSAGRYRIGTIVLHDEGSGKVNIVDGQQRFVTFILLLHWLAGNVQEPNDLALGNVGERHQLSGYALDTSRVNIISNYRFVAETLGLWTEGERKAFAEFLLGDCEVAVLTLTRADEAFQMFDSQNARGRALYPTDLLKAFHIREMSSEHVSRELKLAMVRLWEDIPAVSVNRLFSDYLFKIKCWANGHPVPDLGFSSADIDMFKGIRESDPSNAHNKWAMPFLYAKNFTDDFGQENHTLIRYGALDRVEYPFQIDHPLINGENFFKFVAHYHALAVNCGVLAPANPKAAGAADGPVGQAVAALDAFRGDSRYAYVRNRIDCLLLYYVDRFGEQHLDRAVTLIVRHGLALRVQLTQVRRSSVNNYALGRQAGAAPPVGNLFSDLRGALRATDFLRRPDPRPTDFSRYLDLERFFTTQIGQWT